jgi:hypothetical protein
MGLKICQEFMQDHQISHCEVMQWIAVEMPYLVYLAQTYLEVLIPEDLLKLD